MNHRFELSPLKPLPQFRGWHELGNLPAGQIAPLVVAAENIADRDIGAPGLVEVGDHIRSDKSGPAGDQQHRYCKTGLMDGSALSRSLPKLCPRLARRATRDRQMNKSEFRFII